MARSHRLAIRQRPERPQAVPIHFVLEAETPYAFIYRGVRVLCSPIRIGDVTVALAFTCPRCGARQQMDHSSSVSVMANGLVHTGGIVECENRACHLRIEISEGRAIDLTAWVI